MPEIPESKVQTMHYPMLGVTAHAVTGMATASDPITRARDLEVQLDERNRQFTQQLETVRKQAVEQGRQMAEGEQATWRKQCTHSLNAAIEEFRAGRDNYLARVEQEVVRLALAIAERILHRESQIDPLLLTGAVRVALGQLAESTEVRLRVPAQLREMWAEALRLMPSLPLRPDVVADSGLQDGDVVLETNLGTVNLGVRAQIEEIERGFFDLLDVRRQTTKTEARPDASVPGKRA
jgi:flagellar assembly protein FliH